MTLTPIAGTPTTQPQNVSNIKPRDAATLIVLRRDGDEPRVLMGRRHENHKFMPGKYVFPGGRVDYADSRIHPVSDLTSQVSERLQMRVSGAATAARARALALAAIRETFEETGLALGEPVATGKARSRSTAWQAFFDTGVRPRLNPLHFIARAITPPRRVRRYDTRFFLTVQEDWDHTSFDITPSRELTEVHWVSFAQAEMLDLPRVTRFVLNDLDQRLKHSNSLSFNRKIPFFRYHRSEWLHDQL